MMRGLTPKKAKALAFIREQIEQDLVSPTLQEIATAMGATSKSVAHRAVETLINAGYLARAGHRLRALEIPAMPPAPAIVEHTVMKPVIRTIVKEPVAAHPPRDLAKTAVTRRSRTYVIELDGDVHKRLRRLSRLTSTPAERIIMMAVREFIMDQDRA